MSAKTAPGKAPASPSRSPARGAGGASPTRSSAPKARTTGASPVKGRPAFAGAKGAVKGKVVPPAVGRTVLEVGRTMLALGVLTSRWVQGRDAKIRGRADANAEAEEASGRERKDATKLLKAYAMDLLDKVQSVERSSRSPP